MSLPTGGSLLVLPLLGGLLACDPTPSASAQEPSGPPGVIVISVDTLRADHLGAWGGDPSWTPHLNALAETSGRFLRAYASSNETLFSHGALFASERPSQIAPVTYDFTFSPDQTTLAGAFSAQGWRSGAAVASGHLARVFGLDVGFSDYIESEWWGSFSQTGPLALRWLDRRLEETSPYLLFLHSYDCHSPYTKPGPLGRMATPGYSGVLLGALEDHLLLDQIYQDRVFPDETPVRLRTQQGQIILSTDIHRNLPRRYAAGEGQPLTPGDLDYVRGLYRTAVRYADFQLGRLLVALEARGVLETATIIVLSDHGEGLFSYGHLTHRTSLRDDATQVPLLIRPPGGMVGRDIDTVVSLLDVAPTALSMAGLAVPPEFQGRDLSACLQTSGTDCPDAGPALSEGTMELISARDRTHRLEIEGLAPHDARLPAALQDPAAAGLTLRLLDDQDQPVVDAAAQARLLAHLQAAYPLVPGPTP